MNRIETLPTETQSRIRSTQLLTTLVQVVSELIQNAIDAGSSRVDVTLDVDAWSCNVRDDGPGIPHDLLAGVGSSRYHTSKTYSSSELGDTNTFGFRGEALASIGDLCCLEIASRVPGGSEPWSTIVKGGKCLHTGRSLRWRLPSGQSGTIVSVRDAFYNMPVRRVSHPKAPRTLELVKREIESYALACPSVAFSLENGSAGISGGSTFERDSSKVLVIPATHSCLATFRRLYGRALAEEIEEINVGADGMRIKGFVSLHGAASKMHQFLYVNRHPADVPDLARSIDGVFARSTFGKHAFEDEGKYTPERPEQRRSPRKLEKHPIFVLDISVPPTDVDNCLEPAKLTIKFKNISRVNNFLTAVIKDFLERHGFLKKRLRLDMPDGDGSPRKKAKTRSPALNSRKSSKQSTPMLKAATALSLDQNPGARLGQPSFVRSLAADEIQFLDFNSGRAFIVDARTGNSILQRVEDQTENDDNFFAPSTTSRTIVDTSALRSKQELSHATTPGWISGLLTEWQNPTFLPVGRQVASVGSTAPHTGCCSQTGPQNCASRHIQTHSSQAELSFDRDDLNAARVLGQVGTSFVACVIDAQNVTTSGDPKTNTQPISPSSTLVLIDQHAADERIRVERFLRVLCETHSMFQQQSIVNRDGFKDDDRIMWLEEPVPVLLVRHEAGLLANNARYLAAFASWGILFQDIDLGSAAADEVGASHVQVLVRSVPDVVSKKLLRNNELQTLIKGYLAALESGETPLPAKAEATSSWNAVLRYMPRQLLELVNSKACRGAIMFNDPLRMDQCERLVAQLAKTALFFQCAHGRPSLAPLTELASPRNTLREVDWESFLSNVDTVVHKDI
ncbi:hypothetical protein BKA62DRAFT_690292 [Auriculariales sp. MPI-PUGE-AT-0066]|nr:hypothetical protein BKA62DRAFT_690292 [Auriculariales sp. MPI-PUGE-AT-0066]